MNRNLVVPIDELTETGPSQVTAHDRPSTPDSRRRHATVYDAVAGKVSYGQGPVSEEARPQPQHPKVIKYSTKETPLAPDEVLFRRKYAPERYYEHDIYYAHERDLPNAGQGVLPESDLLKAIHGYASTFYNAKSRDGCNGINVKIAERSMDETALLALGILLEEAGKEVLGSRGDLVFTEGADDALSSDRGGDEVARETAPVVGHDDIAVQNRRKRRKVATANDE